MKHPAAIGALAPALLASALVGSASATRLAEVSPVGKVLPLILNLKSQVETDGVREQASFDKYQCWCENTLGRKANDISAGKESITKLSEQILSLKGQLGSHGAQIEQLKKDISDNKAAQKEATEVRTKENEEYMAEHGESENCIGALESAITALTGAGARGGKGSFRQSLPEAQMLSVAADVRRVLQHGLVWRSTPAKDMEAVRRFVASPGKALSAAQVDRQNPFGDYAPQSTVIQGILKGMLDSYKASIAKAREEEQAKQKAFDELMQTKRAELGTLSTTLRKQESDEASKEKTLADSQTARDDAKAQLDADEGFFEDTKASCKDTATAYSERSRLRTEELSGINRAIEVLGSPEARAIFANSSSTLVQFAAVKEHRATGASPSRAYSKLRELAGKYRSTGLAQVAAQIKTGGHFDKVIVMIDQMVELIRKEEAADIAHRDRCQNAEGKNSNDMEDLQSLQSKTQGEISRLEGKARETQNQIKQLDLLMQDTAKKMEDRLDLRNREHEDFKNALKDDTDAVALLQRAILALSEFYKRNRIPLAMAQQPQYTEDPDKAPELAWKEEYGGRKAESTDIISILSMLVTDVQQEIKTSREDDQAAEAAYEKDKEALEGMLHAQKESKVAAEMALADLQAKLTAKNNVHAQASEDLSEEQKLEATLMNDCSWVETHFQSRRDQRKAELDGLAEARALLGGASKGDSGAAELAVAAGGV